MMRSRRNQAVLLDEGALYEYAVKALGRSMRTEREIERLLKTRVEAGEAGAGKVAAVIAQLKDRRYLDDQAYASIYARLRRENDGFGPLRVERDMERKGISTEQAQAAVKAVYGDSSEEDLARQFLARKRLSKPGTPAEKARVMRRLVAAGFSYSAIVTVMRVWRIDVDESDFPPPE